MYSKNLSKKKKSLCFSKGLKLPYSMFFDFVFYIYWSQPLPYLMHWIILHILYFVPAFSLSLNHHWLTHLYFCLIHYSTAWVWLWIWLTDIYYPSFVFCSIKSCCYTPFFCPRGMAAWWKLTLLVKKILWNLQRTGNICTNVVSMDTCHVSA